MCVFVWLCGPRGAVWGCVGPLYVFADRTAMFLLGLCLLWTGVWRCADEIRACSVLKSLPVRDQC